MVYINININYFDMALQLVKFCNNLTVNKLKYDINISSLSIFLFLSSLLIISYYFIVFRWNRKAANIDEYKKLECCPKVQEGVASPILDGIIYKESVIPTKVDTIVKGGGIEINIYLAPKNGPSVASTIGCNELQQQFPSAASMSIIGNNERHHINPIFDVSKPEAVKDQRNELYGPFSAGYSYNKEIDLNPILKFKQTEEQKLPWKKTNTIYDYNKYK